MGRLIAPALLTVMLLVATAPALADESARAPERLVLGFTGAPPDVDAYEGAPVMHRDAPLGALVVLASDPTAVRAAAQADDRVRYVEADGEATAFHLPDDPNFVYQYGLRQVGAPSGWDVTLGTTAVRVCVADTGLRATHEDVGAARYAGGYDFVNNDTDAEDDHWHGTFVASVAVATTDNGRGGAGVAQATHLAAKVLDGRGRGEWSEIASGIRWCADQGAHVVILSLGAKAGATVLRDAVTYATEKGSLLVAASGNDGYRNGVAYPAKYPEVVAVGCTNAERKVCPYSNGGPELDLVAPGDLVFGAYAESDNSYALGTGTSFSAPHVAGAAALLKSANPQLEAATLRSVLEETAEDLGPDGHDNASGHGLLRIDRALGNESPLLFAIACVKDPTGCVAG